MKRLFITSVCIVGLMGIAHADELSQAEAMKIYKTGQDQFSRINKLTRWWLFSRMTVGE